MLSLSLTVVLVLATMLYMGCFLYSRKLVEDYWQWRFGELPSVSRFDWIYWLGPLSVTGVIGFRLMNLNKEPL